MKEKYCFITNDVETTSIWHNCLRDKTGEYVLKEGMPILLDIYKKYDIKSTFFFTGYFAQKFPEAVKMIIPYGHEVASHGFTHEVDQAFDILPLEKQIEHLKKSKQILEYISGQEVISFRAPAARVNKNTPLALIETGFKIDSSVASQRFDFFLSFGGINKLKWIKTPRLPYKTKTNNLFKKGGSSIIELPLSALIFPYIGTTLRMLPSITRFIRYLLYLETKLNDKPIVFLVHPNELIEENGKTRKIIRRKKNIISYFWADFFRGKLKIKNIGKSAIPLLEREMEFFKKKKYQFLTIKEYCKKTGLLQ